MTSKFQTYVRYKPSGIDWLGNIPEGWQVVAFKELFKPSNEKVKDDPLIELPLSVSGYRGVEQRDVTSMEGQMPSDDVKEYRIVREGQLAVNTMWLNYTGLGVSEYEGYISPAYRSYNINSKIHKRFAHHLLRSILYVQKYTSLLYGVRPNSLQVKTYDFEHIEILLPPLEIQKRIADFLDEKAKIIDGLIAKKEKWIELLHEKRITLISCVVTKGLNPNAKFKSSGIDWLGDIPEDWRVKKLKFIFSVQASNVDKKSYEGEKEVYLCNYVDVYNNEYISSSISFMSATATTDQLKNLALQSNDIIITKDSEMPSDIGVPAIVKENITDLVCGYHLYLLRSLDKGVLSGYVFRFLQSSNVKRYFETHSNGVTRFGLGAYEVNNIPVPIPLWKEQSQIVSFLDTETAKIDKTIALIESQIEKLKEYRSSLINAAVTGKIKI